MAYEFVILGGGVAAGFAAREFVEQGLGPEQLRILSADTLLPYNRPPLSKAFLAGKKTQQQILINPPEFYTDHRIDVRLNTRVEQVELRGRRLYAQGEVIGFEKLLIATGSRVRTLDVPNSTLPGIHYLRLERDSAAIREDAQSARRVVIVGGGYIGMEVSAVLAQQGHEVTVVAAEERLMPRFFTPDMSAFFREYYEARGVRLLFNTRAIAFSGRERVQGVIVEGGDELPADMVVVGIGVVPNVELFEGGELHLDQGLVVNKYLETNLPGIFAAGDIANYNDVIFQKRRRIEHWDNAVEQGRHTARMMLGKHKEFMYVPYFFSDIFDLSYEFWGDTSAADTIVYRGDVASGQFSVWWINEDQLDAAFIMGRPDEERELAPEWIRMRAQIPADVLRDENHSLQQYMETGV